MSTTALTEIYPDIQRAAKTIAQEWPGVIEYDDAVQEISLALLADDYTTKVTTMDEAARRHVLMRIARHIAANYRTEFERHSGQYRYASGEVRAILERGALTEQPEAFNAGALDVQAAWAQLSDAHQSSLRHRYVDGNAPGDSAERKRVTRAIDALAELMNRSVRAQAAEGHHGPGSRTATSNASAALLTRRDT